MIKVVKQRDIKISVSFSKGGRNSRLKCGHVLQALAYFNLALTTKRSKQGLLFGLIWFKILWHPPFI